MMIISSVFFLQEVKNRTISCLLSACVAILNITTSFWLIQSYRVIYKKTRHLSERVL